MINKLNKVISLTILILLNLLNATGQTEFLVTINSITGVFTKIDSLPGVKWIAVDPNFTTFDENNHRFIFKGADINYNSFLYSVDVTTGNIISNPSFPVLSDPSDNISELQYDNSSSTLYGLHWDNSESTEYLVSIDVNTGVFTKIDSLSGVKWIAVSPNYTTFDEVNHRFIFKGADINYNSYLYSVDVTTGNIISNPSFPVLSDPSDNISELQYDNSSSTLYGLHWDNSESTEYLVSIDVYTGVFTKIDSLSGVKWITVNPNYTTFDEYNHRFIFKGADINSNSYLYSVDVTTGNIISNPLFPVLSYPSDNIIELQFDNSSGSLYALHWDANIIIGIISNEMYDHFFNLYPNPFSYSSKIILDKSYCEITIFIYNSSGHVIRKETNFNSSMINIQRDNLSNGIYFIEIFCDHQSIGTRKLIIE